MPLFIDNRPRATVVEKVGLILGCDHTLEGNFPKGTTSDRKECAEVLKQLQNLLIGFAKDG